MKIEVELTEEQWELLCLAMGAATGWFMKEGNRELAHKTFAMSQVIITSVMDQAIINSVLEKEKKGTERTV